MSFRELSRTIEFAKLRRLDFNCLAEKLLSSGDNIDTSIVNRLKETSLSESDNKKLVEVCEELSGRARSGPASFREKADRTINRILRILPNEMSYPFAIEYLNDSLKRRRAWAYTAMHSKELSPNPLPDLVELFNRKKDQKFYNLLRAIHRLLSS